MFCADKFTSHIRNVLARITNTLITAINAKTVLPKMLVMVLEDDVIKYLEHDDYGATEMYGKVITYIEKEIQDALFKFKSFIPQKAKRPGRPQIVWICPSIHKNYGRNTLRKKFGGQLELLLRGKPFTTVLKLKQVWNTDNDNLVAPHNKQLTRDGEYALWKAIDRSISFADRVIFNQGTETFARHRPFFHTNYNTHRHTNRGGCRHDCGRRLPPPPK